MGSSLAWRAALAIALMVGFYALAVGLSGALLFIPYAEWRYAHRLHIKIAAFCVIGALIILHSIVPRPDRFQAPGPRLMPEDHPRLFTELRSLAEATKQALPAEVYLVPEVNAWVSQRGGVMGFGSRRVMGLGLPLLQALDLPELRAVIAHEFGHYHGGDVRIGPWIYKTRQALGRTLEDLAHHSGLLTQPFQWYAALFFRVTLAVSRHQELQADALAAGVAGGPALARGLKTSLGAALAYQPYWSEEVEPVLSAGFLPPLARGFARFLEEPKVVEEIGRAVQEELESGRHDPYDTHPPLRDRLVAIGDAVPPPRAGEGSPALSLLDDVPALEQELVTHLADDSPGDSGGLPSLRPTRELVRVAWDEVGVRVYRPRWEGFLKKHGRALAGITPVSLPGLAWETLGRQLAAPIRRPADEFLPLAEFAVGAALSLLLLRAGFAVDSPPGGALALVGQGERVEPFSLRERLARGPGEAEPWRAFCAKAGITDVDLAGVVLSA